MFNKLKLNEKIMGVYSLIETTDNITSKCFVDDLLFKDANGNKKSFREELINEHISFPKLSDHPVNQKLTTARFELLIGGRMITDIDHQFTVSEMVLGGGHFGIVLRGLNKITREPVAVKLIKQQLFRIKDCYHEIENEKRMLELCKHPNVIRPFEVLQNEHGDFFFPKVYFN